MGAGGNRLPWRLVWCLIAVLAAAMANFTGGEVVHTRTFRSPPLVLGPGDVIDEYLPMEMPTGHIAVKSLKVQVVDGAGTPIPLSETYLHHWVLVRYHVETGSTATFMDLAVPNDGVCHPYLVQMFGLGSETRHTNTAVPAPYGIVVGDPALVPAGKQEVWLINAHAIDTRGAKDRKGCTECACDVYNVTSIFGNPLPPDYEGGLFCCGDKTRCPLRAGFQAETRELFVEMLVSWVDFSDAVKPVQVYILDATDQRTKWDDPAQCNVEYTVPKCVEGATECIHNQDAVAFLPRSGHVIYIDAHLHAGGVSSSLHRANGEELCLSKPKYGLGTEAGNETGYIVGMTTCYPEPGSMYIEAKEKLMVRATYNNTERHTGVMGLVYLLVYEEPQSKTGRGGLWWKILLGVLAVVVVIAAGYGLYVCRKNRNGAATYQPIV